MGIVDAIGTGVRKLYTERKAIEDFNKIKKQAIASRKIIPLL